MNYEKAKDREAAAKAAKELEAKDNNLRRKSDTGPAYPEGMISAREAKSKYFVTGSELESWKKTGTIGKYGRGYSEREIQAAIATRGDIGERIDGARKKRNGRVGGFHYTKNHTLIG